MTPEDRRRAVRAADSASREYDVKHELAVPYVREELDARSLHFSMSAIQSRMRIGRPDALDLDYTRTMMAFLMFAPEPARIAMIGLGGGSLAKFCRRHVPRCALVVVEVNPHVIALRNAFEVPPDDTRFEVIRADGARFVRDTTRRFDVLMIDAFDVDGLPAALGTPRFYDDAFDVLDAGGLFVANLHTGDVHLPVRIERMRRSFGAVLRIDDADAANSVVFARKGAPLRPVAGAARRAQAALAPEAWEQLSAAFARVSSALEQMHG